MHVSSGRPRSAAHREHDEAREGEGGQHDGKGGVIHPRRLHAPRRADEHAIGRCGMMVAGLLPWLLDQSQFEVVPMLHERELYVSENGDTWHLVRGSTSGSVFVRH